LLFPRYPNTFKGRLTPDTARDFRLPFLPDNPPPPGSPEAAGPDGINSGPLADSPQGSDGNLGHLIPDHLPEDPRFNPLFKASQPFKNPIPNDPPWTLLDVLRLAIITGVAIMAFSVIAMMAVTGVVGRQAAAEMARNPKLVVPAQLAAYLVVLAFMNVLVRSYGGSFWKSIHWNWPGSSWIGYVTLGVALAVLVQSASLFLPIPKSLPIESYFRDAAGTWLMAAFGVSIAPLAEELFFRGFLYPALSRKTGAALAIFLTALGFTLIHAPQLARAWAPLLLLLIVGLVLTWVRAHARSVGASFLVHFGYNATLFLLLYLGTDGFRRLDKLH